MLMLRMIYLGGKKSDIYTSPVFGNHSLIFGVLCFAWFVQFAKINFRLNTSNKANIQKLETQVIKSNNSKHV